MQHQSPQELASKFKPFLAASTSSPGAASSLAGALQRSAAAAVGPAKPPAEFQRFPLPSAAAPTPESPRACSATAPTVSLQRENGIVTSIRVECSCGQVIELSCAY